MNTVWSGASSESGPVDDRELVMQCGRPDAEFAADARSSVPAMAAALTAVLDLHHKDDAGPGRAACESCSDIEEVTIFWPCDTVRAIQAALGGEE